METIKKLLLSGASIFLLAACGNDTPEEDPQMDEPADAVEEVIEDMDEETDQTDKEFTLAELSEYDGQNGNLAYVAVDGIVYDVTGVEAWAGGEHAEDLTAGNDYTEEIVTSPHGNDVLADLTVVGTLVEE